MPKSKLIIVGIIAVLTMSAVPVLVKSTTANEYTVGIARLAIAVLAFMPMVVLRGHLLKLSRKQWLQLVTIGVVFGFHWLTYFMSIKLATAAIAALTILTYSVQYLVLAHLFNSEKVSPIEWLAIGVCFAGCIVVAPDFSLSNDVSLGIAIGLLSALFYAAMPLLHQRASDIGHPGAHLGAIFLCATGVHPALGTSKLGPHPTRRLSTIGAWPRMYCFFAWAVG